MKVLDCGCGFGGTLASLNERFSPIELTGLSIDGRQLDRARQLVSPRGENTLEFIEGNACELPFPDQSFDVITAVECIFHFPSRATFFSEAYRVLRPGGKLVLSDFISTNSGPSNFPFFAAWINSLVTQVYGEVESQTLADYAKLSETTGFALVGEKDITEATLPTFEVLATMVSPTLSWEQFVATLVHRMTEWAQRSRQVLYQILTYEKPHANDAEKQSEFI